MAKVELRLTTETLFPLEELPKVPHLHWPAPGSPALFAPVQSSFHLLKPERVTSLVCGPLALQSLGTRCEFVVTLGFFLSPWKKQPEYHGFELSPWDAKFLTLGFRLSPWEMVCHLGN